jgi:rare lipoprotein A (peptidoglycan hydrolase)
MFRAIFFVTSVCLCIIGSTKSLPTFDTSNSTQGHDGVHHEVKTFVRDDGVEQPLSTPPQPRNKHGNLVCTKNRYIKDERQFGVVSWYGNEFHGRRTANGEIFNENASTLAHLTLPMGTRVRVENPITGVVVDARVNDCGPFIQGRIADLSKGLAYQLGLMKSGKGTVIITVL